MPCSSKIIWKMREALTQLTSNKLRFTLTVLGITIGVFLYLFFSVLAYSYMQTSYEEYIDFAEDTLYIYGMISDDVYAYSSHVLENTQSTTFYTCDTLSNLNFDASGVSVSASISLTCTDTPCTQIAVLSSSGVDTVYRTEISLGRDFDREDFLGDKRQVIIPSLLASLLFPGENPIGKQIEFSASDQGDAQPTRYTIIGIYANTPSDKSCINRINKAKPGDSVQISLTMYAPISAIADSEASFFERTGIVYQSNDIDSTYYTANALFDGYESVSVYSKTAHMRRIDELNSGVNGFLSAMMIIIIFISGICISNSMIFSVRERIPEIGIRKSFGADGFDIVARFVFEGVVTAIFGAFIATAVAVALLLCVKAYTDSQPSPFLHVFFAYEILAKTFCFAILEGIISSIVPSVYAARIQIADAVRFD